VGKGTYEGTSYLRSEHHRSVKVKNKIIPVPNRSTMPLLRWINLCYDTVCVLCARGGLCASLSPSSSFGLDHHCDQVKEMGLPL
jgi:hypothetical protein